MILDLKDGRFINLENCAMFEIESNSLGEVKIKLRGEWPKTMEFTICDYGIGENSKEIASIIKDRIIQLIMNGYNRGLKVVDIDVNNLKKYVEDTIAQKMLEGEFE